MTTLLDCPVCGRMPAPHDPDEHPAYQVAAAVKRNAAIAAAGKKFAATRDSLAKTLKGPAFRDAMRPAERDYDQAVLSAHDIYAGDVEDGARAERHDRGDLCDEDTCDDCDAHRAAVKRLDARERYLDGAADYAMDAAKDVRP